MGKINVGKVIAGGLVAGVVINVGEIVLNMVVAADANRQVMERLNLPDMGGAAIGSLTALGFVAGVVLIWLYAAVRPRLGPGPATAAKVGAAVWVFAYVLPGAGLMMMGVMPEFPWTVGFAWGLGQYVAAALAGGWVYRERGEAT